jgi:hypothetical protein
VVKEFLTDQFGLLAGGALLLRRQAGGLPEEVFEEGGADEFFVSTQHALRIS